MSNLSYIQKNNLKRLRDDFPLYAKNNLKIKTKNGGVDPLILNKAQERAHQALEDQLASKDKVRALFLKGRQQGISTYAEGRIYWKTTFNKGLQAFILTHEQAATDNIFSMVQRYHDYSILKPQTGASNAKELYFPMLQSGYKVGTAGSKAVGRSSTIQILHGSEVAFWPNAEYHLAGLMQCVPDLPKTEIILESTANGVGGIFYDLWKSAERGEGDFIPVFIPWYIQQEYRRKIDATFELDESEKKLKKLYSLDDEQLAWRRAKITELRSAELFKQEYPFTPQEAFIASGRRVFDSELVQSARRNCFAPTKRMALVGKKFEKRQDGELRIWFDPDPSCKYVIGGDVAEGLVHGDYSCLDVLDVQSGIQVAQWHGHTSPDNLAQLAKVLAELYNKAFIGIERNNHGLTTLTQLRDSGYPNIYAQRDIENRGSGDKETKKIGWLTTSKSKFKIIDQLQAELRDKTHGIHCKETLDEFDTYIVEDNGSYNAQPRCFDDRIMARAIAGEMLRAHYSYKGLKAA